MSYNIKKYDVYMLYMYLYFHRVNGTFTAKDQYSYSQNYSIINIIVGNLDGYMIKLMHQHDGVNYDLTKYSGHIMPDALLL